MSVPGYLIYVLMCSAGPMYSNSKPYSAASTTPIAEAGPIRRVRRWSADDLCPIRVVHSHQLKEVSHADRDD